MRVSASCSDVSALSNGGQWGIVVVCVFALFLLFDVAITAYAVHNAVRQAEIKNV